MDKVKINDNIDDYRDISALKLYKDEIKNITYKGYNIRKITFFEEKVYVEFVGKDGFAFKEDPLKQFEIEFISKYFEASKDIYKNETLKKMNQEWRVFQNKKEFKENLKTYLNSRIQHIERILEKE